MYEVRPILTESVSFTRPYQRLLKRFAYWLFTLPSLYALHYIVVTLHTVIVILVNEAVKISRYPCFLFDHHLTCVFCSNITAFFKDSTWAHTLYIPTYFYITLYATEIYKKIINSPVTIVCHWLVDLVCLVCSFCTSLMVTLAVAKNNAGVLKSYFADLLSSLTA